MSGDLDRLEDVTAVSENLIDFLQTSAAGFWKEKVDSLRNISHQTPALRGISDEMGIYLAIS